MAALFVAGTGFLGFNAPARGSTTYGATMIGTGSASYKFAKGACTSAPTEQNGNFNIQVGDSVRWENCTDVAHTVTGDSFGSTDQLGKNDTVTYTFNTPGSFPYHCNIHPTMTGTVVVAGQATTTTQTVPPTTVPVPTTAKATTTTASTAAPRATTTTADDIGGVFGDESTTSSSSSTTVFGTATTRALGQGGDGGTSPGLVALLVLGLGGVGTAAALLIRRLRGGGPVAPI
ncbi:MAG TPA: hypothetical protein VMZ22_07825 [Acidimicrobiales bacterium]|nr:hypothetical protein [Acidimicrobiales bacterium]